MGRYLRARKQPKISNKYELDDSAKRIIKTRWREESRASCDHSARLGTRAEPLIINGAGPLRDIR